MSRRSKLEVPIQIFSVGEGENSWNGPEPVLIAEMSALVSWGSSPNNPEIDANSQTVTPTQGDRYGAIRVFLRRIPEELKPQIIEGAWILAPTMANRYFKVVAPDLRGVLPGKYPYRLEAAGV